MIQTITRQVFTDTSIYGSMMVVPAGVTKVRVTSERTTDQTNAVQRADGVGARWVGGSGIGSFGFIDSSGSIWSWGFGSGGELGIGSFTNASYPMLITQSMRALEMFGGSPTYALGVDGTLWASGTGTYGQLGNNNGVASSPGFYPVLLPGRVNKLFTPMYNNSDDFIRAIQGSTFAIDSLNQTWAWGYNSTGQLGVGDVTQRSSPTLVSALPSYTRPTKIYPADLATNLATFFLMETGQVYSCGTNNYGLLGINSAGASIYVPTLMTFPNNATIRDLVVGNGVNAFAIDTNNNLYSWGRNAAGQLMTGDIINRSSPVLVLPGIKVKKVVTSTGSDTMVLTMDGSIYAAGLNSSGVSGANTLAIVSSPVMIGAAQSWQNFWSDGRCAYMLKNDGTLYATGYQPYGELGIGSVATVSSPTLVQGTLNLLGTISSMRMTQGFTFLQMADGTLWSWGKNTNGILGTNSTAAAVSTPTAVAGNFQFKQFLTSGSPTLLALNGITSDGRLMSWGSNSFGQSGTNDVVPRSSPTLVYNYKLPDIRSEIPDVRYVDVTPGQTLYITWGGINYLGNTPVGYLANKITVEY